MKLQKTLNSETKGRKLIPGLTQLLSKRPDQFAPNQWPAYFSKAKGAIIWDLDGNEYLDMSISGMGANILGYCEESVNNAVKHVVDLCNNCSLNCEEEVKLAELLCKLHPWADMVRYARGGGEAMTIAVRIARAATGRDKVAFCGYHGWHDWYLAANIESEHNLEGHLLPGLSPRGVPKALRGTSIPFHYNQINEIEKILTENQNEIAAIIMEPMRDEKPKQNYLERIREVADINGAILIFDEVSSGFRLNPGGIHLSLGIDPDIAVFAKAISNGYPMGAIIGRNKVMDYFQQTFISSTYWTDRIGPAAALQTIKTFMENSVHLHIIELGKRVKTIWENTASQLGLKIKIGGLDPMAHFQFEHENSEALMTLYTQEMLKNGILASHRCYLNASHSSDHIKRFENVVKMSFKTVKNAIESKSVFQLLEGPVRTSGFKRLN